MASLSQIQSVNSISGLRLSLCMQQDHDCFDNWQGCCY